MTKMFDSKENQQGWVFLEYFSNSADENAEFQY